MDKTTDKNYGFEVIFILSVICIFFSGIVSTILSSINLHKIIFKFKETSKIVSQQKANE